MQWDRAFAFLSAYTARRTKHRLVDGEEILWLHSVTLEKQEIVAQFCVEYSGDETMGSEFAGRALQKLLASEFCSGCEASARSDRYR